MVGRAGQTDTPAPPAVPANTPAPPDPDGDVEGGMPESEAQVMSPPHPPETAEYACVRKLRKAPQKRDSGTDMGEPPAPPPRHAPPSHPAPPPPHPHSTKLPRRNVDAFNVPAFPRVRKTNTPKNGIKALLTEPLMMINGDGYIRTDRMNALVIVGQRINMLVILGQLIYPRCHIITSLY